MKIRLIDTVEELRLAFTKWPEQGSYSSMQSADWILSWAEIYLESNNDLTGSARPHVLIVESNLEPLLLVPFYLQKSWVTGNTIRWIGDGQTCSDHCTILKNEAAFDHSISNVNATLKRALDLVVNWLQDHQANWDRIHLEAIDQSDQMMVEFTNSLEQAGFQLEQCETEGSAVVDLPNSMEDYLKSLSRNHRKRCRRWLRRYFESGRIEVREINALEGLETAWQNLLALHHERRQVKKESTAFENSQFCQFHRNLLSRWVPLGKASLREVYLDGELVAMEYVLKQNGSVYCYQSGMITREHGDGFGNLSILALIRESIANGFNTLDLLRGEEGYKSHWNAKPVAAYDLRVHASTFSGRFQNVIRQAIRFAKRSKQAALEFRQAQ